jgi:thymidylate kinase
MMNLTPKPNVRAEEIEAERERFRLEIESLSLPQFGVGKPSGPRVVALEGPNAVGKTWLCHVLSSRLGVPSCLGTDIAWSSEPFKTRMIRDADWQASALFFLSGCLEQMRLLRQQTEPLILMDRSFWSTLAVHAATNPSRLHTLVTMLRPIADCIEIPALTMVLDASFATCQTRMAKKTGIARALDELTANEMFHAREREFYRWLGRRAPGIVFLNVDSITADEAVSQAARLME